MIYQESKAKALCSDSLFRLTRERPAALCERLEHKDCACVGAKQGHQSHKNRHARSRRTSASKLARQAAEDGRNRGQIQGPRQSKGSAGQEYSESQYEKVSKMDTDFTQLLCRRLSPRALTSSKLSQNMKRYGKIGSRPPRPLLGSVPGRWHKTRTCGGSGRGTASRSSASSSRWASGQACAALPKASPRASR